MGGFLIVVVCEVVDEICSCGLVGVAGCLAFSVPEDDLEAEVVVEAFWDAVQLQIVLDADGSEFLHDEVTVVAPEVVKDDCNVAGECVVSIAATVGGASVATAKMAVVAVLGVLAWGDVLATDVAGVGVVVFLTIGFGHLEDDWTVEFFLVGFSELYHIF